MKIKKIFIIETLAIFFSMFLFHFVYKIFPNFLIASIFPVNESLFEHLKLIYTTQIIVSLIIFIILIRKKKEVNNYFLGLFGSTIINIALFFTIYLPIYNRFGEGIVYTMLIFLVTLIFSEYLFYIMTKKKDNPLLNAISIILIVLGFSILAFLTYNPLHNDFFFDTQEEKYGINEKN